MKQQWAYRARQFYAALTGKVERHEMAEAERVLGPALYALFASMPQQYRRHALTVHRRVVAGGNADTAVGMAALLHDIGKYDPDSGRYVTIFHRVMVVLLEALPAGNSLMGWLSKQRRGRGVVLYPFYLSKYHPVLGARLAAKHGAPAEVVALISGHHRRGGQSKQLLILQAADDAS